MGSKPDQPPLVVIVGPTASGKSALALDIAERWNGEIIAADSRTIYKGMDIGTAKPTLTDRDRVRHHLIDIVDPDQPFTVSDFQRLALAAITDITARGKLPILVGGTGLYVDAVLFNFSFRGASDPGQRQKIASLSVDELQAALKSLGLPLPRNERNPRHLVRVIETGGAPAVRQQLRPNTCIIGLDVDRETLAQRIADRVNAMFEAGLEKEVTDLVDAYGWERPPLQTIGYQEFRLYLSGGISAQELRQLIITHTLQYAKRQKTWFRRNKSIHWISKTDEAVALVTTLLNK